MSKQHFSWQHLSHLVFAGKGYICRYIFTNKYLIDINHHFVSIRTVSLGPCNGLQICGKRGRGMVGKLELSVYQSPRHCLCCEFGAEIAV